MNNHVTDLWYFGVCFRVARLGLLFGAVVLVQGNFLSLNRLCLEGDPLLLWTFLILLCFGLLGVHHCCHHELRRHRDAMRQVRH